MRPLEHFLCLLTFNTIMLIIDLTNAYICARYMIKESVWENKISKFNWAIMVSFVWAIGFQAWVLLNLWKT